ncbi:MAG: hypothetical protein EOM44_05085 [Bacteroidia bacterium]|nr:hypothetical protein [Bacteroidia bacterium]
MLWPAELKRQVGKPPASHRYNLIPLLRSSPGGVQRELVVQDLPGHKSTTFRRYDKIFICIYLLKCPCSASLSVFEIFPVLNNIHYL